MFESKRTARVGNKGLATTFYNEKNSEIASDLVKILVECNQEVPDFLQTYRSNDL
jgi:ATP-dependent RNA helicase DDX3X